MLASVSRVRALVLVLVCQGQWPLLGASPLVSTSGGGEGVISEFEDLPILVPDTSAVDSGLLKQVGADKFLSLWHIFVLSGKVVVSDEPWTLVVPLNAGLSRDPSFLADQEFTREVLLNHVVLGDAVEVFSSATSFSSSPSAPHPPYYSLADSELKFTTEGGDAFVNGIRFTGDQFRHGNGIVYIIEETIPLSQPEFLQFVPLMELDSNPTAGNFLNLVEENGDAAVIDTAPGNSIVVEAIFDSVPNPILVPTEPSTGATSDPSKTSSRPTRFDKFRNRSPRPARNHSANAHDDLIALLAQALSSTPSPAQHQSTTPQLPATPDFIHEKSIAVPQNMEAGENHSDIFVEFADEAFPASAQNTFASSMIHALNKLHSNGAEFIHHFEDAQLGQYLSPNKNYTALIPTNDAFYQYYPIDWGFNPFLVANFTRDVLLNHVLEGDIHLHQFLDPVEIQTIEGRIIKVIKNSDGHLVINGNMIPRETELEIPNGRIYFIHQLLFVDYNRVNQLREEYPFLETAPLLSFPWPSSPFLTHLWDRLQDNPNTRLFAHFLRNSDIAHLVSSSDENLNSVSYTAFVPMDSALKKSFGSDRLAALSREETNAFLLEHIVPGYLFEEDFEDGFNLLSLTNKAIPIRMTSHDDIFVGPAKILKPQLFVYNLGAIFIIDRPITEVKNNEQPVAKFTKEMERVLPSPTVPSSLDSEAKRKIEENLFLQHMNVLQEDTPPPVTSEPQIKYEVRTEISFSRQINDGAIVPVPREVLEKAKVL